jgi:capsid protein
MEQQSLFPSPRQKKSAQRRRAITKASPAGPLVSAFYEAASTTRRAAGWIAPTLGPNDSMLGSLALLRDRSRQAVRNDGYGRGLIDKITSNVVGTGLKPMSQAEDRAPGGFRQQLQALWLLWTDESDADGVCDWYQQQEQATRCWMEAGEAFLRLRSRLPQDGLRVSLQVQVLEPELCPHSYNSTTAERATRSRPALSSTPSVAGWPTGSTPCGRAA